MDRAKRATELAALLDGEIKDHELAEALHTWIGQDPGFQEEYAEQREVKTLLSRLPEYEAPPYLATRVMGEISAKSRRKTSVLWRMWATAIGGFILCLSGASVWQMAQPAANLSVIAHQVQPGVSMNMDMLYKAPVWADESIPVADYKITRSMPVMDPQLADFLEFANDAHNYARAMYAADLISPDLPGAVMVLDTQGGTN